MTASTGAPRGRLFILLGFVAAGAGIGLYAAQIAMRRLTMPWYMPVLATLGVLLVAAGLWQRRGVWRIVAMVAITLLAGAEWAMLLGTRLPAYTGPVTVGKTFPPFTTLRADGAPFTRRDLEGGQNSVLVFFRGRW